MCGVRAADRLLGSAAVRGWARLKRGLHTEICERRVSAAWRVWRGCLERVLRLTTHLEVCPGPEGRFPRQPPTNYDNLFILLNSHIHIEEPTIVLITKEETKQLKQQNSIGRMAGFKRKTPRGTCN